MPDTPSLDGHAVRTRRTRARVLAESLALFNERGEARVTTGAIAEALGISPGNLYYHFRNKDAIVEELVRDFEARIGIEPGIPADAATAIEDLWLYLHLMLEAIQDYRFLYRNLDDLLMRNRRLRGLFNRIAERKLAAVVALCEGLVRRGAMRAQPKEIRALARNVLVVATYGQGAYQVMALFAPYLQGEARRHLDRLAMSYVE